MEVSQWVTIIGNFGFPICLSIYLLVRLESKIEALNSVIAQLVDVIGDIKNSLK